MDSHIKEAIDLLSEEYKAEAGEYLLSLSFLVDMRELSPQELSTLFMRTKMDEKKDN